MQKTTPYLSIVTPVYNESENLLELVDRLLKAAKQVHHSFEIILVNDGSTDNSFSLIKQLAEQHQTIKYLCFSRNFGHQIAVMAGLDYCKGEVIVIIDGDLQDPPELIPALHEKHLEGYNVVYARRRNRKGESTLKLQTAKWFYRILQKLTDIEIPVDTGDFRLIDRKIVKQLKLMPEQNKFLRGQISWLGFKQTHILFDRDERKFGTTGYSYKKMITFALDGITAFSNIPLLFVRNLGFWMALFSFAVICYALFSHFILDRTITGWTSLIISSAFIGGIQLFSLGIIGEYISRMNRNIKNRPLYIIDEENINEE